MQAVPKADAPSVKIAKSLKFASQKLDKRWVMSASIANKAAAFLYDLASRTAMYSGTSATAAKIGEPKRSVSLGIAREVNIPEKVAQKT